MCQFELDIWPSTTESAAELNLTLDQTGLRDVPSKGQVVPALIRTWHYKHTHRGEATDSSKHYQLWH